MLQPPEPASRPLSIRTTGTSATQQDKTGETWKMNVTKENCWEDLILTLGTSSWFAINVGKGPAGVAPSPSFALEPEGPFREGTSYKEKAEHPGAYISIRICKVGLPTSM